MIYLLHCNWVDTRWQ